MPITERNREQARLVREWASENGYQLGRRIPAYVLDAYNEAHRETQHDTGGDGKKS